MYTLNGRKVWPNWTFFWSTSRPESHRMIREAAKKVDFFYSPLRAGVGGLRWSTKEKRFFLTFFLICSRLRIRHILILILVY